MLKNGRHLSFNQMRDLLLLQMKVHINELSMANILYFAEVTNNAGVHINMDMSKEKIINAHIKDRKFIHLKEYAEGIFYTNINDRTIITNPNNVSLNAYSRLSNVKQNSEF